MNYLEAKAHVLSVQFDTDFAAELVRYNDGETQIPAVFDFNQSIAGASADTGLVTIMMTDVPSPQYRDTITRGDGVTWYVYSDKKNGNVAVESNGMWKIKITANERFHAWI